MSPESRELIVPLEKLSRVESSELAKNEKIIQDGLHTFMEVGNALLTIRDKRLYRQEYPNFKDYCRQRWGMSKTHANRLIASASVATNVQRVGVLPINEGQVRPLTKLDPATQKKVWAQVVKKTTIPGEISASVVREAIEKVTGEPAVDRNYRPRPERGPLKELVTRERIVNELNMWWGKSCSRFRTSRAEDVFIAIRDVIERGV